MWMFQVNSWTKSWLDAVWMVINHLYYADDLVLLSPSAHGMQKLLKPRSHMYCNLSATALRLKTAATNATTVRSKRHFFSVADQSATGRRQLSLKVGDWLEMGCDWSATGWRLVVDRSAISWRLTIEQTICCVGVIMNKALINCYSMAISIYIYWLCHIVYFHSYYN